MLQIYVWAKTGNIDKNKKSFGFEFNSNEGVSTAANSSLDSDLLQKIQKVLSYVLLQKKNSLVFYEFLLEQIISVFRKKTKLL